MALQRSRFLALAAAAALALSACSSPAPSSSPTAAAASSVTVTDNNGSHTIATPPKSVVATDNRTFQTLSEFGVKLSAGAVALMPDTNPYKKDASIVDTGNHREPNLEAIVAANPDLVIVGQRYTGHYENIAKLVPEAKVLLLDPREGQPWDQEMKRQTTVLGEIFGKQAEAKAINDKFDAAIARVKAAYDPADKVMALNVSNGNIGYISADEGRTLGEAVRFLGLTESFSVTNPTMDHEGEEVSVEAIAESNPDWFLVMDRTAGVGASDGAEVRPALEIIDNNPALANVTAVKNDAVVVMQDDAYLNESVQMYTSFLNAFADALEKAK
ncbi:MAG: ABC transporter substrate-binding protein [Propioniciclava sp.]|uniref:siderophore ABC transporter substrate-binding protein n=1 Tax=Propioniciclava sp. TaxID=2038686 RepID=UPI0039E54685